MALVSWVGRTSAQTDADSPLDETLMDSIRLDLVHNREWIGKSYYAGAVEDHDHDGVNSKAMTIPPDTITRTELKFTGGSWSTSISATNINAINLLEYAHYPKQRASNAGDIEVFGGSGAPLSTSFAFQMWARNTTGVARTWYGEYLYHSASEQIIEVATNLAGEIVGVHVTEKGNVDSMQFIDANKLVIPITTEILTVDTNPEFFVSSIKMQVKIDAESLHKLNKDDLKHTIKIL